MNLLIFQNPYDFFQFFLRFGKKKFEILKNERNVTNFGYLFKNNFCFTLKCYFMLCELTVSRL